MLLTIFTQGNRPQKAHWSLVLAHAPKLTNRFLFGVCRPLFGRAHKNMIFIGRKWCFLVEGRGSQIGEFWEIFGVL
jgi:hypothetical protein